MTRDAAEIIEMPAAKAATRRPVLAVGLGRGGGGKSTVLAEMVWRAEAQGRSVIVADGDARSKTLTGLFPDALQPASEEMPDIQRFLTGLLNRMAKEQRSAVLDLGGGDRALMELGRDIRLVEFCDRRRIEPLAIFCVGPDPEDLAHVHSIFSAGYFRPERMILFMNEGVIRAGQNVAGAFERTVKDGRFRELTGAGARPLLLNRLACMNLIRTSPAGFYKAAGGGADLDPVEEFMVEDWLAGLEVARHEEGVAEWLP